MSKEMIYAVVIHQEPIATGVFSMTLKVGEMAKEVVPGQFINVYCKDQSRILPRPISICESHRSKGWIRIVYRVAGEGTKEISVLHAGDTLRIMGPLGNGYTLEDKKAIIIGGGIGIPPMLELAKNLKCEKEIVLGYRDELFLDDEFAMHGNVTISTEDGKHGVKGNVIDAIKECKITGDVIYACGPMPMLRGVKEYGLANGIETQISLEERMACGIGACLACVCKTKEKDSHSHVNNARVCKDGPVFFAQEVDI